MFDRQAGYPLYHWLKAGKGVKQVLFLFFSKRIHCFLFLIYFLFKRKDYMLYPLPCFQVVVSKDTKDPNNLFYLLLLLLCQDHQHNTTTIYIHKDTTTTTQIKSNQTSVNHTNTLTIRRLWCILSPVQNNTNHQP